MVGVDTGFIHLAAALGVPTVEIFGATAAEKVGGIGVKHLIATSKQHFECMPCWKRKCSHKDSHTYAACMQAVTPQQVWQLLQKHLS